jgi:hypothetical protein
VRGNEKHAVNLRDNRPSVALYGGVRAGRANGKQQQVGMCAWSCRPSRRAVRTCVDAVKDRRPGRVFRAGISRETVQGWTGRVPQT